MNPDSPIDPRSAIEASLTALLLGELPHEQAAALHQQLAQDPELAKLYERLKQTVNLVRETITSPVPQAADQPTPLRLSGQRRERLLQHFKTVAPKEFARPRRRVMPWLVPVGIAAALVALMVATLVPNFTKARTSAMASWKLSSPVSEMTERLQISERAPVPPVEKNFRYGLDLNRNGQMEQSASQGEGRVLGLPVASPAPAVPEPPRPVGTAIVLPKTVELADATTASPVLEGGNSWSVSASTRGFYDDSSGRAGGVGGSGAVGDSFFTQPEAKVPSEAPNTVLAWQDIMHSKQGNVALAAGSVPTLGRDGELLPSAPQNRDFALRQGYVAISPATANGTVEAPAIVPPPVATSAPAQAAPGTSSEVGATEQRVFRLANAAPSETADQLAQLFPESSASKGGAGAGISGNTSTTINGSDQTKLENRVVAVPDPRTSSVTVTAPKTLMPQIGNMIADLDSDKGRKGGVEYFDLQNAAPQDVNKNLQDLFERNIRQQNSPLQKRMASNTQPSKGAGVPIDGNGNVGGVPAMDKPTDATASAGTLQGFTTFAGEKRAIMKALPVAPLPPAASPEEAKPKDLLVSGLRPSPSPSFHGGSMLGPLAPETAPSGEDKGVTQDRRRALRSPKEDGLSGGSGGALGTPALARPAEVVVNEAATRQVERLASPQKPTESPPSGSWPSDTGKLSTEAAGQVLGVQPPEADVKAKFAETKQEDQKALGFAWYLGNVQKNQGSIKAQGGTAPSEQALNGAGTLGFNLAAAGTESPNSRLSFDASAQPSPANPDGDKVPILGDVPVLGNLSRSTPQVKAADLNTMIGDAYFSTDPEKRRIAHIADGDTAKYLPQAPPQETAVNEAVYRQANHITLSQKLAEGRAAQERGDLSTAAKRYNDAWELEQKIGSGVDAEREQTVAGLAAVRPDLARPPTTAAPKATDQGLTSGLRSIGPLAYAKDSAKGVELNKESLARERSTPESENAAAQNVHSLNVVGYVNGTLPATNVITAGAMEATRRLEFKRKPRTTEVASTQPYFEAKRELDEAQRFRQILDAKITSEKIDVELPKTMMVEVVDKAVPASSPSSTLWDKVRGKSGDYKSTARIKVERDQSDISGVVDNAVKGGYDPYFVQSEEELIQSEAILGKVVKDLGLKDAWAKKKGAGDKLTEAEAVTLLKQSLDLHPVKGTSLLEIGAKSDKPEEAAKIANAVADAYRAHRLEQRKQLSKASTEALEERYAQQTAKVIEAQKKADDLRVKLNISDAAAVGEGPSPLMSADTLRKLEGLRIESKAEYVRHVTLLDRLKSLGNERGPEALAQALPTAAPDPGLNSLLDQLTMAEQRLVTLEKDYGPEHAEVIKCKTTADDLHSKIKSWVDGIMHGLDARVASLSNSLDNLEKEVGKATTNDMLRAAQSRPYFEAKRNLEELQRFRQVLEKNQAGTASQTNQADVAPSKPAAPAPIPQPEVQTAENAFSTFSLNVSDVSFKLAGASLEKGLMPEPANIRSEEFINAFDYGDPEPPPGVPVAFAWERAQYPFAQNRDLLRFSVKTAALGRQPGRPLNLVLLLDNSGSMERADRVRIIREALRVLAEQLQPQDKLSVITFARTPRLFADGAPGSDAGAIAMALTELTPQGGTNLEDAMNLAYQTALRHYLANGVNRVVLLTDGAANLGNVDPEALKQKVEANRKQGVALDCFGIGWEGYNDDLLEVLSRNGDGRYAFLNTPEEVGYEFAAKLAGALQVAASDVKVQVEFNPARVTAYRQIGYAKHQLTKEQFRDNTVNAAQIGAAEAGNALYTVEVNPSGTGPLCTVRVRFRIPGTADYREHAWDVPFNGNAVALEQASPAMRLTATASALSEWLASSPYATEVTPDRLLGYLSGVPEVYGADARPKKLKWMIRQAKSIAGK